VFVWFPSIILRTVTAQQQRYKTCCAFFGVEDFFNFVFLFSSGVVMVEVVLVVLIWILTP